MKFAAKTLAMIVIVFALFFVYKTAAVQASTVYINDSDPAVTWSGAWSTIHTTETPEIYQAYKNDAHITNHQGDYSEFSFTGNTISLIGMIGDDLGMADIYIDGVKDKTVDMYIDVPGGGRLFNRAVYNRFGLADGQHTIKVVVTGNKNAASSDSNVVVDAFQARTADLAKGTSVAVSSSLEENGYAASQLTDGNPRTGWSSDSLPGEDHSESVTVDLQMTNYIDRIDLQPLPGGKGFPKSWKIEVSKDNAYWTMVADSGSAAFKGGGASVKSLRIAAQTVRYIRFTGTSLAADHFNDGYRMKLGEISAYYDNYKPAGKSLAQPHALYYISASEGDDDNDGRSPQSAWKTLTRASAMIYGPGNSILLKKGDTWTNETFYPHGNGTKDNPIVISAYGEGPRPKIKAGYGAAYGIKIVDAHGYKITGLEFSDSVNGIMVLADGTVGHEFLWVEDNDFHDLTAASIEPDLIMPFPEWYYGSGVAVVGFLDPDTRGQTLYRNITIKNNTFERTDTGIVNFIRDKPMNLDGGPSNAWYFNRAAMTDVLISDVSIKKSYKSGGIMLYGVTSGVVDNAFIDETGYQRGMFWGVAACQVTYSENVVVKNSEFAHTYRENNSPDGEGFDFESGNVNVTLFNNYIHDNVGPSMLFYGQNGGWKGNNANNVIEGNRLYNNGTAGTNDHSQVFKNYPSNTGIIKNNKIKLRFDGQSISYSPLIFSATNYVYDSLGAQISGPGITPVNDNDEAIAYTGTWRTASDNRYFGKNAKIGNTAGDAVELRFWGQTMNVIGAVGPEYGKADVFLDGQPGGRIDFSSHSALYNQVVFARTGLESGLHTIRIVAVGDGDIAIDAFDYYDGDRRPQKPKVNYALKAAVTASSDVGGWGWQTEFLNDGIRSARQDEQRKGWSSTNDLAHDHEEWVQFDLGGMKRFNEIDLYANDIEPGIYFPIDFKIEVSNDKVHWTKAAEKSGVARPTDNLVRIVLDASQQARYVRITGTKLMSNPNENNYYRMQLAEVEIYDNGLTFDGSNWVESGGIYSQAASVGDHAAFYDNESYDNSEISVRIRLGEAGAGDNWAGVNIRKSQTIVPGWADGYLAFINPQGELYLLKAENTTMLAGPVATGLHPAENPVKLRVTAGGGNIKVYVNDAASPAIDVNDGSYTQGYFGLATHNTAALFTDLLVNNAPLGAGSGDNSETFSAHLSSSGTVISPGKMVQLNVQAVKAEGGEADLSNARIEYLSDRMDLLTMDAQGNVGLSPGTVNGVTTAAVWAKVTSGQQIVLSDPITLVLSPSEGTEPFRTNRALHGAVQATSDVNGLGWSASFLTDGITSAASDPDRKGWSSTNDLTNPHEEAVTVDLGDGRTFNEIDLYANDYEIGIYFPVDFTIAVSDDQIQWTEVADLTNYARPTEGRQRFLLDKTYHARYVKVTGTKLMSNPNENSYYRMQLAEVEVLDNAYLFRDPGFDAVTGGIAQANDAGIHLADYDAQTFGDTDVTAVIKMNSYSNRDNWYGVSIRKQDPAKAPWEDGYFVYMRENGDITLMKGGLVILANSIKTGLDPVRQAVKLHIFAQGDHLRVFVNDGADPVIDVVDDSFTQGHIGLATKNASVDFLALSVNGNLLAVQP